MATFSDSVREAVNQAIMDRKQGKEAPKYPHTERSSELEQMIRLVEQEEQAQLRAGQQKQAPEPQVVPVEPPQKSFVQAEEVRRNGRVEPQITPKEKQGSYVKTEETREKERSGKQDTPPLP